jgi:hypothetical protein
MDRMLSAWMPENVNRSISRVRAISVEFDADDLDHLVQN